MSRLAVVALLGGLVIVGGTPSSSVEAAPGSALRRTVLENGLTVLVLPRPTAPAVAFQVWYRVGSADEREGERGLAHFLEHLMFKGTTTLPKGEIDALTHRNGGRNNAFTSYDVTVYHFTFAPDRWETALRIEADRMRNLVLDPGEFEAERRVVLEELKEGLDEPWDALDNEVIGAAYRVHPYRHPVIGHTEDIERVTRETVMAFYRRHYTPANATAIVVGPVDADRAIERVREAFGKVEGPAAPDGYRTPEPKQRGERRIVSRIESSTVDRFEAAWHTVAASHDDDAVLDVVHTLLGRGRSSWLRSRLVDREGLLTSVSTSNETRRDPGLFWIWGELTKGTDIAVVEKAIEEELTRLRSGKIPAEELARAKKQAEAAVVFGRETADGAAEEIGWLAVTGIWNAFPKRIERLRAVTAEDVVRVANAYLHVDNRTFGRGTGPRGKAKRADDETAAAPSAIELKPRRVELPNGLTLLIERRAGAPVAAVRADVAADRLVEKEPGLAHLVGEMLLAGAGERNREELAEAVERLGGVIGSSSRGVAVKVLADDLPAAIEVAADVLRRPTFPAAELERVKKRIASELAAENDTPQRLASLRFRKLAYGEGHPLGRNPRGSSDSVAALDREDVLAHHRTWFVPNNTTLAITGDVDPDEVEKLIRERFDDWKTAKVPARPSGDVALPGKRIHERVERPGRQVNIYLGHAGIRRSHPDYAPLLVLDNILGWSPVFSDRLSRELRENRGLCYSTWAGLAQLAGAEPGLFTAFVGTSPETAEEAREALVAEIVRIRDEPVRVEELDAARSHLTGSRVFRFETAEQIAERLLELERSGLPFDTPRKLLEKIATVSVEDVQRVAREHLRPDRLVIVELGPKAE
jgi:zinc protease